jgi:hypothetical protein
MSIQQCCDVCEESWPEDQLVHIERYHKNMCPDCLRQLIDDLEHHLHNLRHVESAIELYNQEKVL